MLKDKIDLDYGYTMPDIQHATVRQTVSYNWNTEKHMEKVLSELHSIEDKEI